MGLAEHLTGRGEEVVAAGGHLVESLGKNDFSGFREKIQVLFAVIPHPWHDSGDLGHYESWQSMLYMGFRTTQVDVEAEKASSRGRSDMVLKHEGQVFVLEFKMVKDGTGTEEGLDSAITQIREREKPAGDSCRGTLTICQG